MNSTTVVPGFAWSYSQLKNYETCPKRYYHYNVAKDVTEPESAELREGNDLHKMFELRLKGQPLPMGYTQYEGLLSRFVASPGQLYTEQKLALTSAFAPVAFFGKNVWFRTVVDAAKVRDDFAAIADWKNGKPKEDRTQLQLMTASIFAHQPQVQRVRSMLVFVAHDQVERAEYVRSDLVEIWGEILPRVRKLEQARAQQEYPPKPSGLCRRYCAVVSCPHYGRGG